MCCKKVYFYVHLSVQISFFAKCAKMLKCEFLRLFSYFRLITFYSRLCKEKDPPLVSGFLGKRGTLLKTKGVAVCSVQNTYSLVRTVWLGSVYLLKFLIRNLSYMYPLHLTQPYSHSAAAPPPELMKFTTLDQAIYNYSMGQMTRCYSIYCVYNYCWLVK